MKILGVIPARYASTRFPGKPLALIGDKTMIHRTYSQACKSSLDAVVVATDDERIFAEVKSFGGNVVMTRNDHHSGTDRCREALSLMSEPYDAVVNIQGDEPFINPVQINQVAECLQLHDAPIATLARKIVDLNVFDNPNSVKVVFDINHKALYFSRYPIPYMRSVNAEQRLNSMDFYKHIGIYAYQSKVLQEITSLPQGRLEKAESLEQLRWLENGYPIYVSVTDIAEGVSIDTPEDLLSIPRELL